MNAAGTFSGLGYGQSGQYSMVGLPIITDANVATNLGAGTNQDEIYIVAADEMHLWESPGQPTYVRFEQPDGKVAVRIVMFGFSAFTAGRYPKAIAKIGGTGLVTPTFALTFSPIGLAASVWNMAIWCGGIGTCVSPFPTCAAAQSTIKRMWQPPPDSGQKSSCSCTPPRSQCFPARRTGYRGLG
jgi:hypothetical protein